jgi:hypothetical protein
VTILSTGSAGFFVAGVFSDNILFFPVSGIALVSLFLIFIIHNDHQDRIKIQIEIKKNEKDYVDALARKDKSAALMHGRAFYASMRNDGRLTHQDEQAIANDLSTMD